MSTVDVWFRQEVWRWRSAAAVAWSGLLLSPLTLMYLLINNFHPLHPITWIIGSLSGVLSPSNWLFMMLLGAAVLAVAMVDAKHFTPLIPVLACRWDCVWSVVRPARLLHGAGHALAGAVITWCLTAITVSNARMQGLTAPCNTEERNARSMCLNEQHVFVVLHGALVGWMYSISFFLYTNNYLAFPPIQQSKFFSVKSQLLSLCINSSYTVLKHMAFFCVAYFLLGASLVRWFITSNIAVSVDSERSVDSVWGILDVGLLIHTALTGLTVHVMFSITALMHRVYHTQALRFPIEAQFEQERGLCLQDAMAQQNNPLVQHLAYQDLYLLSRHSLDRRLQLFSLSQLGGHPHYWNAVSEQCLSLLNNFASQITAYNASLLNGPIRQLSGDGKPVYNNNATTTINSADSLSLNRSTGTDASGLVPPLPTDQNRGHTAAAQVQPGKKHLFPFLTAPLPDAASRLQFSNAQAVSWAVQALSHLVTASYTEDRYGVVQKSLADILTALLNTHEAVERHLKLASVSRKPHKGGNTEEHEDNAALRFALKGALKTSIYRIITTFSTHLNAIPLSIDHKRRLGQFQDYRE